MLVDRLHGGGGTKEDPHSFSHDHLAIEDLTDPNSRVDFVKRHHHPTEGFQRRPCMDRGRLVDQVSDGEEMLRPKNSRIGQILGQVSKKADKSGQEAGRRTCLP